MTLPACIGCGSKSVQAVNTDVVVIAIAMFRRIDRLQFGTGSNLQHIPIHESGS